MNYTMMHGLTARRQLCHEPKIQELLAINRIETLLTALAKSLYTFSVSL